MNVYKDKNTLLVRLLEVHCDIISLALIKISGDIEFVDEYKIAFDELKEVFHHENIGAIIKEGDADAGI